MRLYPWLPIFFIGTYLFVTVNIFISDWQQALSGMFWFVAGLPIYFFMKRAVRGLLLRSESYVLCVLQLTMDLSFIIT